MDDTPFHLLTSQSGNNIYHAEVWRDPFKTWDARWRIIRTDRLPCEGRMRQFLGYEHNLTDATNLAYANLAKIEGPRS